MAESTLTIKFKGLEGELLEKMVESGLFATKSEVIRSALVHYAIETNLFERKKLWERVKAVPRRKVSDAQLAKDIEAVKNDA